MEETKTLDTKPPLENGDGHMTSELLWDLDKCSALCPQYECMQDINELTGRVLGRRLEREESICIQREPTPGSRKQYLCL